ncbi:NAD(+)/NADH kinase [Methylacidimicrobium sp. B4]|uniref:NAD(+)/NADH kinase n=1 Tax=Methylacidimicrobium sp. B4 TaxID=2796139 RepID=UPI001A8F096F|nr:NAD(+)/NADH kinase [Methylacidimicrobium sp. B4]QSR83830.1 NAD(+)/NADH kinase [Methylacidimicrobium sp. B4]
MLRIGVIANRKKPGARALAREIQQFSGKHGFPFLWEEQTARLIGVAGRDLARLIAEVDLLIVAGGDGSLLRVVHEVYPNPVPILGVNIGGLGFLTAVTREEILEALPDLAAGLLRHSQRLALEVRGEVGGQELHIPCVFNDVVFFRGSSSHMARIEVLAGDLPVTEFQADGLVVATPTGSTAYALSAGGPIVVPEARVFGLTPLCPHSLTNRTLVFSADSRVRMTVPERAIPVRLEFDGQSSGVLHHGDWVEIRAAPHPVTLAFLARRDFFQILRQKLRWSGASVPTPGRQVETDRRRS